MASPTSADIVINRNGVFKDLFDVANKIISGFYQGSQIIQAMKYYKTIMTDNAKETNFYNI